MCIQIARHFHHVVLHSQLRFNGGMDRGIVLRVVISIAVIGEFEEACGHA